MVAARVEGGARDRRRAWPTEIERVRARPRSTEGGGAIRSRRGPRAPGAGAHLAAARGDGHRRAVRQCFGLDRRQALWAAGAVAQSRPGRLAGVVTGATAPQLPGMTPAEEAVADLWATGVAPDGHPTSSCATS